MNTDPLSRLITLGNLSSELSKFCDREDLMLVLKDTTTGKFLRLVTSTIGPALILNQGGLDRIADQSLDLSLALLPRSSFSRFVPEGCETAFDDLNQTRVVSNTLDVLLRCGVSHEGVVVAFSATEATEHEGLRIHSVISFDGVLTDRQLMEVEALSFTISSLSVVVPNLAEPNFSQTRIEDLHDENVSFFSA